jgi:DNA-binding CsgD family transcriptional regulator
MRHPGRVALSEMQLEILRSVRAEEPLRQIAVSNLLSVAEVAEIPRQIRRELQVDSTSAAVDAAQAAGLLD